jgi:hypothetical protein
MPGLLAQICPLTGTDWFADGGDVPVGADVFLPKPYNTSGLLTALEQLLQPRTV